MRFVAILLMAVFVFLDQLLKNLAVSQLKPIGTKTILPGLLDFTYVQNPGAAFGIFPNKTLFFAIITILVSAIIVIILFAYSKHTFLTVAASVLVVAGGIGNLIDRLSYGYVVDYIKVSFFPPVFNFADCCVTVGVVLFIIYVLFFADKHPKGHERVMRSRKW